MKFEETANNTSFAVRIDIRSDDRWDVTVVCEFTGITASETQPCKPEDLTECINDTVKASRRILAMNLRDTYSKLKSALHSEHMNKVKRLDGEK